MIYRYVDGRPKICRMIGEVYYKQNLGKDSVRKGAGQEKVKQFLNGFEKKAEKVTQNPCLFLFNLLVHW